MKFKTPSLSNILFIVFLGLLLFPQTRTPIQVAVNKVKMLVWSPSELDDEDQSQLQPFEYQLMDLNRNTNNIKIGQGKVTFISYWATWCPPCIAELPSIESLYKAYGDQIDFLLISNEDPEVIKAFLVKKGYELPTYIPQMKPLEKLFDRSIPTNFVLDKTGKIIIKETGAADWNSEKVRRVLDGLLKS